MELNQVKKVRDQLLPISGHIRLYLDSTVYYDNKLANFIWDDTDQIVYVVNTTNSQEQARYPVQIDAVKYDAIDCMISLLKKDELISYLQKLIDNGITTTDKAKEIINNYQEKGIFNLTGLDIQFTPKSYNK